MSFTAAVVQAPIPALDPGEPRASQLANARLAARRIDAICDSHDPAPQLVVLPVLALTGPYRSQSGVPMHAVAVDLSDPQVFAPILEVCARRSLYVATSTQERTTAFPDHFFHTGVVFGPAGLVLRAPKAQAWSVPSVTSLRDIREAYADAFGSDAILPVAHTPLGRLGLLVENEMLVPEAARLLAAKGAEIILHPTLEQARRFVAPFDAFRQAQALANHVWWLSANGSRLAEPVGDQPRGLLGGRSMIVDPLGQVVATAGPSDGVAVTTIDLSTLAATRQAGRRNTEPAWELYRRS